MIIVSRCPCRISLLGGSSDLDWFVNKKGKGFSVGLSVSSYSRVIVGYRGGNCSRGLLNYSSREEYKSIDSISHPIIRKCLQKLSVHKPIELASFGDSLLGGGLASSSSFIVALIKSLSELNGVELTNKKIAELACEIEVKDSDGSIGRQDQYLCALGGINFLSFRKNKNVSQISHPFITKAITKYANELYLVNTSISRSATEQLSNMKSDSSSFNSIEKILEIAESFISEAESLNNIDLITDKLESSILQSWEIKKSMKGVMNDQLESIQGKLLEDGFNIIKILGAGGGGYFLARYNGNNLKESINNLQNLKIYIKKVEIDFDGCKSWQL